MDDSTGPAARKTGTKTGTMRSPRSGAVCPTGAHPKNTGGKKGRSGRKPDYFHERAAELCNDPTTWDVQLSRARSGDLNALRFAAEYTHEKPAEKKELSGEVTVKVVYDD